MDAHGMLVRILIIQTTTADCTQVVALIEGFIAERLYFAGNAGKIFSVCTESAVKGFKT